MYCSNLRLTFIVVLIPNFGFCNLGTFYIFIINIIISLYQPIFMNHYFVINSPNTNSHEKIISWFWPCWLHIKIIIKGSYYKNLPFFHLTSLWNLRCWNKLSFKLPLSRLSWDNIKKDSTRGQSYRCLWIWHWYWNIYG